LYQLCTTSFLSEISQYIKFGDLVTGEEAAPVLFDSEHALPPETPITMPNLAAEMSIDISDESSRLSNDEEDMLLKVGINFT
jgi:hypothetical protein